MEMVDSSLSDYRLEAPTQDSLHDYQIVLLDVMAHLSEMYRRSIPGERLFSFPSIASSKKDFPEVSS